MQEDFRFLHINERGYADQEAFRYIDHKKQIVTVVYAQFYDDIERAITCLNQKICPLKGAHIGILARNSYHYLVYFYAIIGAGAVAVPLNPDKSWDEISYEVDFAELTGIVEDGEYRRFVSEFDKRYGNILIGISDYLAVEKKTAWEEPASSDDTAIVYTSGTTGHSKAVVLTYSNLVSVSNATTSFFLTSMEISKLDTIQFYFCLPMYHMFAICMIISCISNGFPTSLNIQSKYFQRDLETLEATCAAMVPVQIEYLSALLTPGSVTRLGGLKNIVYGGAPCKLNIVNNLFSYGIIVRNGYGLTENLIVTRNDSLDSAKRISVGRPYGDCEVRIFDGEVVIRSGTLMRCYYKNPKATAEVIKDGWFHTGDLGYIDEEGYLYLTGRKKNLIILSSGENVSPEELEKLLSENSDIRECIVKEKDNKICAEIYCDDIRQEDIREFIRQTNAKLIMYKRISLVEFRDKPFERTASGKIKKNG